MYNFRVLKSEYELETAVECEGTVMSTLNSSFSIDARYDNMKENFVFTVGRRNAGVSNGDNNPPGLVDELMIKLGDSLFPAVLRVSNTAEILGIENFNEINGRWEKTCKEILERAYSVPAANYIELAKKNMRDEKVFLEAFGNQTFIQLLFRVKSHDFFWFTVRNLSRVCHTDIIKCEQAETRGNKTTFESADDRNESCRFDYVFSELGDVLSVKGEFRTLDGAQKELIKKISVKVNENNRKIKKASKFVSFLMD